MIKCPMRFHILFRSWSSAVMWTFEANGTDRARTSLPVMGAGAIINYQCCRVVMGVVFNRRVGLRRPQLQQQQNNGSLYSRRAWWTRRLFTVHYVLSFYLQCVTYQSLIPFLVFWPFFFGLKLSTTTTLALLCSNVSDALLLCWEML